MIDWRHKRQGLLCLILNNWTFCLLVLFLFSVFIFSAITIVDFSRVDDKWMLLDNPLVENLSFSSTYFYKLLYSYNNIQYSPLNTLYYAIIYQIDGFNPIVYHISSIVLHAINTVLVYQFVKLVFSVFNQKHTHYSSLLVATLWLILPINVESVVWISASKILLYSFFTLLSLLSFIKFLVKQKTVQLWLCMLLFICSFLCKEQAVITPVAYLLFYLIYKKNIALPLQRKMIVFLVICFFLSAIFSFITMNANTGSMPKNYDYPFHQRLVLSFYCLFFYLFNTFIPLSLHYHYSFPMRAGELLPAFFYIFPFLFLLIVFNLNKKIFKNPFLIFCIFGFFTFIGLCLQIFPLRRPAMLADRYMYLPSLFLIMPCIALLIEYLHNSTRVWVKNLIKIFIIIYLCILTVYSKNLVANWSRLNLLVYEPYKQPVSKNKI